jgi:hypothetical protein
LNVIAELDIWHAAEQTRKLYGADAAIHSAMRADKLLNQGNTEGFGMWKRVVAALNELDRTTPQDGEARH